METIGDPSESIPEYGLTEMYTPAGRALVDVVFVHGLDGHPYRTWATDKNFWPKHLLPPILKQEEARILVYGYNANVTPVADSVSEQKRHHSNHCKLSKIYDGSAKDARDGIPCPRCEMVEARDELRALNLQSKDKIHNHAEALLAYLCANRARQNATERPIIFVTHSLGGLIVKRALVDSFATRGHKTVRRRSIYVSTYGILFLGTPHRGFDIERWISRWKPKPGSVEYPKPIDLLDFRPQIIDSLGIKNETLQNIDRQFIQLSDKFRMYFFYEGKPTNILGDWVYVVEEESAVLVIQDVEHASIQQDHTHMCQFESENSPGFVVVTEAIQWYAAEAPNKIQADWKSERAESKVRTEAQVRELLGDALYLADGATNTLGGKGDDPSGSSSLLDSKIRRVEYQERYYIVPRERAEHFIGREAQLRKISSHFATGSQKERTQVLILHALGGQGKSQIAIEYCQTSREQYAGIFWVNASSEELAVQSYARIAAALSGSSASEIGDGYTAVKFVTDHLEAWDQRWLLIFDNYDAPEEFPNIRNFYPEFGQGHVIFTSRRNHDLDRLGYLLEIPAMDIREGVSLLLRGHSDQDIEQHFTSASKIVDRLGGLALAIDQAAAYIRSRNLPLDQLGFFLETYDRRRKDILSHLPHFWEYGTMQKHGKEERKKALSAFTTWEMSLEQLKTDDNSSSNVMTQFLTLSAFFNPTRIEEWLFRRYCERHQCTEDCSVWEGLFCASDQESIDASHDGSGHRSDHDSSQERDDNPNQGSHNASNPESNDEIYVENDDGRNNSSLSDLASNANSFALNRKARWDSTKFLDVLSKFKNMSLIQSLEWHSEGAIFSLHPLIRDWLQLREGKDSRQRMITESVAVVVASARWGYSQTPSLELKTSLLAHIDACTLNDDHFTKEQHQLGNDIHDFESCRNAWLLAEFYNDQGRYVTAEKFLRRLLAAQTKAWGIDYAKTLQTMTEMGLNLLNQFKFDEAEKILRQTVQSKKRLLGEEHESTLLSLRILSLVLTRQDKYSEAESIQRQLLQGYEKTLGKVHKVTIESSRLLAETLSKQGNLVEAEEMQREMLQLSETLLGRQHWDTIYIMIELAITLRRLCKYKEAEALGREGTQSSERILGKQHPLTLVSMQILAITLFRLQRSEEALKLCRETLQLYEKVWGKNYPDTLTCMHDLAWMLSQDESSHHEAEQLCRQVVVLRKKLLGIKHRDTLFSMGLLASILLKHESNHQEAEKILRKLYELRKKVLGSEHPKTINTMHDLGWILSQHESSYHEGEQVLRQTLILRGKVLGSEHPDTIKTMRRLVCVLRLQGNCDEAEDISQQLSSRMIKMKTALDDSLNIKRSGESASTSSQIEESRKKTRRTFKT